MHTRTVILTALMAALTAIGAFLRIPTPISSFTLQFFFTAMAGLLLGPACGALSQAVYVLLGLAGAPIFTAGGGLTYALQPTFGFLLGLIPAAWVAGMLTRRGGGLARIALACLAALAALYAVGLPYMYAILNFYSGVRYGIWQTVFGGMLIFLPFDAIKIAAASLLAVRLLPRLRLSARPATARR